MNILLHFDWTMRQNLPRIPTLIQFLLSHRMRSVLFALLFTSLLCWDAVALSADVPHDYPVDAEGLLNVFVVVSPI